MIGLSVPRKTTSQSSDDVSVGYVLQHVFSTIEGGWAGVGLDMVWVGKYLSSLS